MAVKKQIPCLEGWLTMPPQEPRVIGSKCKSCGHYFFPKAKSCRNPYCKKKDPMGDALISRKGKLFSYTVNHYPPPPPYHALDPFAPFGVACIEMPEGIKVCGQVSKSANLDSLKIGMEMELIIDKLWEEEGKEMIGYKFRPA